MENLNAEQIKNRLEQLSLEECMTGVTIKGHSVVHLLRDTLALINSQEQRIKELTEENERLRAEVSVKKKLLDKNVDLEDKVKADTVRKMRSEIKDRCIKGGIYPAFVASTINQIAKEILEGEG